MKKKINEVTDFTMDPQIQDAIEKNARKGWLEYNNSKEAEIRRIKKEQKKEKILTALIIVFILAITCFLLIKLTNSAMDSCVANGHSERYCYDKLA